MPDQFQPGDVVTLKSGGPKMTVEQMGDEYGKAKVWCVWFDGQKQMSSKFEPNTLKVVTQGESAASHPPSKGSQWA